MYEFVGKSAPFLILAFLALLDGGKSPQKATGEVRLEMR